MGNQLDGGLIELHRLLVALQEVQEAIDRGPRQLKVRQQTVVQKQAELEAQKQKHKSLRMTADQKSLQLKSNEAKIGDLRGKLNQAQSNREFDIIKQQIAADSVANSVLEDEILDALEKVDLAQQDIKRLEADVAQAQADEKRIAAEIAAALPGHQSRQAELNSAISAAEALLPADIHVPYRRLVQAYGAAALAPVEGNTCTSCYVSLPAQMAMQVRAGQIFFCKTCGRLLYSAPAE
ncbi:MAG: phospholipase [Planctomycetes bacterium]|nr:phospholipase [Planctomycetota bacterium]